MSELYGGAVVLFLIALWIFLADQWKRHREYKSLHRHADEVRAANWNTPLVCGNGCIRNVILTETETPVRAGVLRVRPWADEVLGGGVELDVNWRREAFDVYLTVLCAQQK